MPDGVVDLVPGVPEVPLDQQQLSNIQAVVPDIIQIVFAIGKPQKKVVAK